MIFIKKCDVCGKRFRLLKDNRYVAVDRPIGFDCLSKPAIFYNAFDCPHCGCQNIVGEIEGYESKETYNLNGILDKIRDEIEKRCGITLGQENEPAITVYDAIQIIDKYKKGE